MRLVIERLGAAARDPEASLRVLARYRDHLPPEAALKKWWAGPVSVGSVHASKGLEADYIIVTDLMADTRGFPSTIQDDDVMRLVLPEREAFPHAEERRLFYVALTRARREVHLIAPQAVASPFAFELFDMKVGEHLGMDSQCNPKCPACDSGRLLRSPRTGGQYCTNMPLCDFFPPRCGACAKPMRFDWDVANGYVCTDHPDTCPPMCPRCKWGLLVTREFTSRRTGVPFVKEGCHTWPRTRCSGKPRVEPPVPPGNGRRP
jgi:DNA helicase-4